MNDTKKWAEDTFAHAGFKDYRHTERLIKLASDIADNAGSSLAKASPDPASLEGAYRFIRNPKINTEQIAQAGFQHTYNKVKDMPLVLAIQDTTGLSYKHSVCDELGSVSSANKGKRAKGRSLFVHSTLMLDTQNGHVLGLGDQHYWHRENKIDGTKHDKRKRDKTEKESYKWQRNIETLSQRYGSLSNVIDICDREADTYEYLDHQLSHQHRFVVRSASDRRLVGISNKLSNALGSQPPKGSFIVKVAQKGGRKAREAKIELRSMTVTLKKPSNIKNASEALTVNVVQCQEINAADENEKLCWNLYTSEVIDTREDVEKIVQYYEWRWHIEEFHKVWKSDGTEVESLRMQTKDSLERTALILGFVAVYLYQLRHMVQDHEEAKNIPCTEHLSKQSWKILWKATEKTKPPEQVPSMYWAYYAIAKLGRWYDSKRNGRVGIKAYWTGWFKLLELIGTYEMLKELDLD